MRKISTLYKKDPKDLGRVINEINPENSWVFTDEGVRATRKFDGSACAIIDGYLYKRHDYKKGKTPHHQAISCQEPDAITGHWPHWLVVDPEKPENLWHWEAFCNLMPHDRVDGTYELCGPKVQGNPEKFERHTLVPHGLEEVLVNLKACDFHGYYVYLQSVDIEGIVFHHPDGRMCKLRKSDFGIKR